MPPTIRTLRDLGRGGEADDDNNSGGSPKNYKSHTKDVKTACIPGLFEGHHAKKLLARIHKEFRPLLQKRGYNVTSVTEMCDCGDGLDHLPGARRKKRIMPNNVMGYNQSYLRGGYKSHTIHLRLRQPTNHDVFYEYESIAKTMSHELAHCEISPHNAKFYKLMEEIQEQHAAFLAKGIVVDKAGFPVGSDQAYTLGKDHGRQPQKTSQTSKDSQNSAAKAAVQRQKRQQLTGVGGQRLGGSTGEFTKWLRPGEAAGMAAEQRVAEQRRLDEVWCQPCEPEIIELSDDEEEVREEKKEDRNVDDHAQHQVGKQDSKPSAPPREKKKPCKRDPERLSNSIKDTQQSNSVPSVAKLPSKSTFVDLTGSDEDGDANETCSSGRPVKRPRRTGTKNVKAEQKWSCRRCTFQNAGLALVCLMCGASKNIGQSSLELAQQLREMEAEAAASGPAAQARNSQQQIDRVKDREVAQSVRDFGFNIYGKTK